MAGKVELTPLLNRYIAYRATNEPPNGNRLLCSIRRLAYEIFEAREIPVTDWKRFEYCYPRTEVAVSSFWSLGSSAVEKFCSLWGPRSDKTCLKTIFDWKGEVSEDKYQQLIFATALRIDDLSLVRSCIEKDRQFLTKLDTSFDRDLNVQLTLFGTCHRLAARFGGVQLLEYLLTVTAGSSPVNKSLRATLLGGASRFNRTDIVEFLYNFKREEAPWNLIAFNDRRNLQIAQTTSSLQLLKFVQGSLFQSFPFSETSWRSMGETRLIAAARENRLDTLAYNLRRESRDSEGRRIMYGGSARARNIPLEGTSNAGNVAVAEYLIEHGADPDLAIPVAAEWGRTEFIRAMLQAGRATGNAMGRAAAGGYWDIVQLLLDAGADVNASTGKVSPLAHAISREHTSVVKLLLDRGAELKFDGTAQECVRRAKKDGLDSMLALLEESGVDTRELA